MLNVKLAISLGGSLWYVMSGRTVLGIFDTEAEARQTIRHANAAELSARNDVRNWEGEGGHLR